MKYDYLVVGSGLFGSTFARIMSEAGCSVLVIEKADHVGGHVHTENREGVIVHLFGPHLFHTKHKSVWDFVNRFSEFNHYHHRVVANNDNRIISLPFNMMTYHQFWGCTTPDDARRELERRRVPIKNPKNLEEWCLSQVGEEIYEVLIYHYTKKQWMREPRDLPMSIIKRLANRMTYNDWYFDDPYQGIPVHGYTPMVENMLDGIDVRLESDFFDGWKNWRNHAHKLVYTGSLDEYLNYQYGELEYRTLEFQHIVRDGNFQGIGQMNFTGGSSAYTRVVEHKHFYFAENLPKTVVTYEFPVQWRRNMPRYYPINDEVNTKTYKKYREAVLSDTDVIVGGRLGRFAYFDMDTTIHSAMKEANKQLGV